MQLVKYSSSTCQPCKQLKRSLESVSHPLVESMLEVEVDTSTDENAKQKARDLGVRRVPVMVLFNEDGTVAKRYDGFMTAKQVEEFLGV